MDDRIPVLLDTDIGSDIDDAIALAYLLGQPRCDLLGIATVTGEPDRRAALASAICRAAGREVPIASGAARPLLAAQRQARAPQAEVLPRWPHRTAFPPNAAVDLLRETIRGRPGEIVLLTIGPLTNAAILFALDPAIPGSLRGLVSMAGVYGRGPAEGRLGWNASCDPHATAIVCAAPVPDHVLYGLDVTLRVRMEAGAFRRRMRGGALEVVRDMGEVWLRERDHVTFHDPLAAAAIFDPSLCAYEAGRVEVEIADEARLGETGWAGGAVDPERGRPPHRIAVDVDPERFFDHLFSVLGA